MWLVQFSGLADLRLEISVGPQEVQQSGSCLLHFLRLIWVLVGQADHLEQSCVGERLGRAREFRHSVIVGRLHYEHHAETSTSGLHLNINLGEHAGTVERCDRSLDFLLRVRLACLLHN